MTTAPTSEHVRRLQRREIPRLAALLSDDFGRRSGPAAALPHHYLLDALDRGEHDRFAVWPGTEILGVLYFGPTGFVVPAGFPQAGAGLAEHAERGGWRVLVGDAAIGRALLDAAPRAVFRRRVNAREQRFMAALAPSDLPAPAGLRLAGSGDVERLTDLACRLHVEDQMGPAIARSGRAAVRARMADSVARGATWVVERDRRVVAKVDLALYSRRRGAQLAGVYVAAPWRGQGLAAGAIAALARHLLDDGLPGVTLHVRADNAPAIAAYRRAGFFDQGSWLLALR